MSISKLKTASLAVTIAITALAAGCDTIGSMTSRMRGGGDSQLSQHASAYWKQNSSQGYMSREQTMAYKGPDGRRADFSKLDTDRDGRISETEWRGVSQ